jgi:hypothetical protein
MSEPETQHRFAIVHSDGSMGVMPGDMDLMGAATECEFTNVHERDPQHRSRVAIVKVQLVEQMNITSRREAKLWKDTSATPEDIA